MRFPRGDFCIICNSEDFYIRARIRRRLVSDSAKPRRLPFAKFTSQLRGQTGCVRGIAKGTSYSRAEKCRRRSRFSCPLGKSDTKSIHVYLRTCGVARRSAEHVVRKADSPDLLTAVRLAVSLPKILIGDMSINLWNTSLYVDLCILNTSISMKIKLTCIWKIQSCNDMTHLNRSNIFRILYIFLLKVKVFGILIWH